MASFVGRVDIAVALLPSSSSIVVVLPTHRPSPLSCSCSVHRRCAPLSITVESSLCRPSPSPLRSRCPLPSITVEELSYRPLTSSRRRAVHRHHATSSIATIAIAVTFAPSIAVTPSIAVAAVDVPSRSRLLSPSRCRWAVQRVALPSRRPSPLPLHRRRAPFSLSLLVDCCFFNPPPLPSRLPLPAPSSTLRHCCVVAGEAIVVAVVVIIVLPSTHTPPPAFRRRLPPLLIVIFLSIQGSFTC